MVEIDESKKVRFVIKYGLVCAIAISAICASLVWYIMFSMGSVDIYDAKIATNTVGAKVRTAGVIDKLLVQNGDRVKAGDVIAQVKVEITEEQIKQLEKNYELSLKNLEQVRKGVTVSTPKVTPGRSTGPSESELSNAKSRADRMSQLYEMGAVSGAKRDEAVAAYESLKASKVTVAPSVSYETVVQPANAQAVKQAEMAVKQAQAALLAAKNSTSATTIVAPVDGVVYLNDIEEGTKVKPGDVVAYIGDSDSTWVEAYLTEDEVQYAELGKLAAFYVDRQKFEGTITEILLPEELKEQVSLNTDGTYENPYPEGKTVVKISIPSNSSIVHPGKKVSISLRK